MEEAYEKHIKNIENHQFTRDSIVEDTNLSEDCIQEEVLLNNEIEIVEEHNNKSQKKTVAATFVSLLNQGYRPDQAANKLNSTVTKLFGKDTFKEDVKKLLDTYTLSSEMRKELVRSSLNKILSENINSGDFRDKKIALEAAKQISQDPEVGLNAPPQLGVQINLEGVSSLLSKISIEEPKPSVELIDIKPIEIEEIKET